ncbi:MAG: DMT family transporter [Rhizobiales bacterium]|nr:DMT family transporter [Hyphomicrobiales bacterium]
MAIEKRMGLLAWAMLITLSILWGGSFFFSEVALRALPPFTVVFLRVALGALVLWVFFLASVSKTERKGLPWKDFMIMGLLNNAIPFSLLVWGQTQISSSLASIINATTPFFTVLVAHVLLADERMSKAKVMGVFAGFTGIVVLMGPGAFGGGDVGLAGQIACIGAAVSYALAATFGRRFSKVTPLATATGQVTCSSVLLLPLMCLVDQPWTLSVPGWDVIGSVIGVAAGSTALAYILYFRILQLAGATNVALVTFLVPVSAIVLGTLILGEVLLPEHIAGMALIAAGLAIIDGRILERMRTAQKPA